MRPLENPQARSLLDPAQSWKTSGLGPIGSDGVSTVRAVQQRATVGWSASAGQYTLLGNVYVRGCGEVELTLGGKRLTVKDSPQDDDGYAQFTLSGWVAQPAEGLRFISKCHPNPAQPILLYQGDLVQITPTSAPQGQLWAAAGVALALMILLTLWLRPWRG